MLVIQCNCWTYDESIGPKLKYPSFALLEGVKYVLKYVRPVYANFATKLKNICYGIGPKLVQK